MVLTSTLRSIYLKGRVTDLPPGFHAPSVPNGQEWTRSPGLHPAPAWVQGPKDSGCLSQLSPARQRELGQRWSRRWLALLRQNTIPVIPVLRFAKAGGGVWIRVTALHPTCKSLGSIPGSAAAPARADLGRRQWWLQGLGLCRSQESAELSFQLLASAPAVSWAIAVVVE